MKTLVLIRHAKSDWTSDHADIDRPLARRGRRQAPGSGAWIAANLSLDLAIVSPARRARSTWELISAELSHDVEAVWDDRIYGGDLLAVVREVPDSADTVALVGHNPELEDLVRRLTGSWVAMPTSAVAVVDLPGSWSDAGPGATLRTSGRPPQ